MSLTSFSRRFILRSASTSPPSGLVFGRPSVSKTTALGSEPSLRSSSRASSRPPQRFVHPRGARPSRTVWSCLTCAGGDR